MSKLIAIDAGHGSNTAGKRTPDGYREHYANVAMAMYFDEAAKRCGFRTLRVGWDDANAKDDEDMSLSARQQKIKNAKCNASISFHYNHAGTPSWSSAEGIETFYHSTHYASSKKLAEDVQKYLVKGTSQKNRGVKHAEFAMINCRTMNTEASVLIEAGFMSNKREAELMKNQAFLKETAEEACEGFCDFYGVKYVAPGNQTASTKPTTTQTDKTFKVRVSVASLNIRKGPGTTYGICGVINDKGTYTIVETNGSWGKLKSGAGWINCSDKYCKRV